MPRLAVAPLPLLAALLLCACPPGGGGGDGGQDAGPLDAGPEPTGWWRGKVFYELFVRSWADTDGDGVGDLKGVIARLDTLRAPDGGRSPTALGVDAVWLMPIYPSASYHGYDVIDYQAVNPEYGSLADLDALIAAAHARGLRLILDFVPNHTSLEHPWFQDSSAGGTHRDWYVWREPAPTAAHWYSRNGSNYYAYFWSGMPDLNWRTAAVEQAVGDAMLYWLDRGVDGFRLDAVRYLVESADLAATGIADQPETHQVLQRLYARLSTAHPEVLLVGEVWTDQATVGTYWAPGARELQLAFSFDEARALVLSLAAGTRSEFLNAVVAAEASLAGKDRGFEAPFLTNHDQKRAMQQLQGNVAAARLGAATLLAMPGAPFLYYGEEIGMQGGADNDDTNKRTPMRWTPTGDTFGFSDAGTAWFHPLPVEAAGVDVATQQGDPGSLWNLYRRLIDLRHDTPALGTRDSARVAVTVVTPSPSSQSFQPLALLRGGGAQRVLFIGNFGASALGTLTLPLDGTPTVLFSEGLTGTPHAAGGTLTLDGLQGRGFAFIAL